MQSGDALAGLIRVADIPRHWASQRPDAPALWENGISLTYAKLQVFATANSSAAAVHAGQRGGVRLPDDEVGQVAFGPTAIDATPEDRELAEQVAALIYTSGTTGAPKGVMVTHAGLLHFCRVSIVARRLTEGDVVYAASPLSHIFGIATILLSTLYAGASCYLEPRFTPEAAVEALSRFEVSVLYAVPTLFSRLLAHWRDWSRPAHFPKLRYVYAGGSALDPALKRKVEAAFDLPLHHGYGMTEYAGSMFVTRIDYPRRDCLPGELNPDCEVRIVPTGETSDSSVEDIAIHFDEIGADFDANLAVAICHNRLFNATRVEEDASLPIANAVRDALRL